MGLGANDAPDEGLDLIDAVWPMVGQLPLIIVFPTIRPGAGTARSHDVHGWRSTCAAGLNGALQVEPAARPVDRAFQCCLRRNFEREDGLREYQAERLVRIVADERRVVM